MENGEQHWIVGPGKRRRLIKDRSGYRTGMLEVQGVAGSDGRRTLWSVRCDCGAVKVWPFENLTKGNKSCGCSRGKMIGQANTTHGLTKHSAYQVWNCMRQRCTLPNHRAWKNYGGRGITVCDAWMRSFDAFWADMGPTWAPGLELDRRNNNSGYSPENCHWVTRRDNIRNKRNNVVLPTPNGPMPLWQAVEVSGIGKTTLHYRLKHNWPAERMFDKPHPQNRCTTSSTADPTTALP